MNKIKALPSIIKRHYHAFVGAVCMGMITTDIALAEDADVSAPLTILKNARQKAQSSNLNTDSIESGLGQGASIVVIVAGLIGLVLALISGYKLYQASQDEQSRESTGRSIAGLIIGSLITIIAVIVAFFTNMVTAN